MGLELVGAGEEEEEEEPRKLQKMFFLLALLWPQCHVSKCNCTFHFHSFRLLNFHSSYTPRDHSLVAFYVISSEELLGVLVGGEGQDGTEGYRPAVTQVGSAVELHAIALGPWGLARC